MADAEPEQKTEETPKEKSAAAGGSSGKTVWVIAAVVAVVSAGGGYGISMLSANTSLNMFKPSAPAAAEPPKLAIDNPTGTEATWYYKLDPIVANLDEPGALRYIRIAVYLEMDGTAQQEQCQALIDGKKPILVNWLQLYLAGRSLEEVKGERYLKIMQAQILEGFNQILFPGSKSLIKGVLFGELNIQ